LLYCLIAAAANKLKYKNSLKGCRRHVFDDFVIINRVCGHGRCIMFKNIIKELLIRFKRGIMSKVWQMFRFYRNFSIKIKLGVILTLIILIPLISIGYLSYKNSENVIKNNSTQYSQDILKTIKQHLNDYILNLNMISQNVISDERINPSNATSQNDPLSNYENDYQAGDILKNIILSVNEIQSICIISNQSYYFADNNKTKTSIKNIIPSGSSILEHIKDLAREKDGSPVWYLINHGSLTPSYLLYARTIYNRNSYKEIGVMVILVSTEYFNDIFSSLENKDMQDVVVLSQDNNVIFSKNKSSTNLPASIFEKLKNQGTITEGNNLISYISMEDPTWRVVSIVPLDVLYRDIKGLGQKIIFSCIMTALIICLIGFFMAFDFISSINKLVNGMKKVQQGEDDVSIELNRNDEIGYMGEAFNNMVREISMLEKWIYREQLTRKESEIKFLQAQINPHFLFNTLESINWMAQLENAPQISEMVTALASLMEASIVRQDKFIPFSKELEYIDNYMMIMKSRFDGRLELVCEIDECALDFMIPKLLIQPIVENAVYHGIGNSRNYGVVRLHAEIAEDMFKIVVEDNGAGFDPQKLEMVKQSLLIDDETYFEKIETKKAGGIGLENVNRRLKLYYGAENGLKIESKRGEYTRIMINIPYPNK
jgi:two-component system sensor histidine kinase YesM